MREILFRGKRKDNGEWVEGYYLCKPNYDYSDLEYFIIIPFGSTVEVDPETVCQYTGLKDKHRDKIFEGDILIFINPDTRMSDGGLDVVRWNEKSASFYTEYFRDDKSWRFGGFTEFYASNHDITGNVFDNPELLLGEE